MARPPYLFCICPDAGLIKEHIDSIALEFAPSSGGTWERHVFRGEEDLPQAFWTHLTVQGLFNTPKLIIIRNAQNLPIDTWKNLSDSISAVNENTWLIMCLEVVFDKNFPKIPATIQKVKCFEAAKKKNYIWLNSGLDTKQIKMYVQNRVKEYGLSFEGNAFEALCGSVPPDATAIENELQKLFLAANDKVIREDMINVGAYLPENDIFSFISHIQAGKIAAAWSEIRRGQHDITALFFPFLALLARDTRILWQILAKEQVHLHFSVAHSKEQCAKKLGFAGIAKIFAYIVQAEQQVKSGECDPEQALESMVVDLARLYKTGH